VWRACCHFPVEIFAYFDIHAGSVAGKGGHPLSMQRFFLENRESCQAGDCRLSP